MMLERTRGSEGLPLDLGVRVAAVHEARAADITGEGLSIATAGDLDGGAHLLVPWAAVEPVGEELRSTAEDHSIEE